MAVHPFAQAGLPVGGDEAGIEKLGHQVVQVVVGLEDYIAARAAVAAAGTALGPKRFPKKGDASFAAVTRPAINFYLVNEHECRSEIKKRRG
jgi:hypothetical protein